MQLLLFDLPEERLDRRQPSQVQEKHVNQHEDEVPVEKSDLPLRLRPKILHQHHHVEEEWNQNDRHNHRSQGRYVLVDCLLGDEAVLEVKLLLNFLPVLYDDHWSDQDHGEDQEEDPQDDSLRRADHRVLREVFPDDVRLGERLVELPAVDL